MQIQANATTLEVQDSGGTGTPVLLIMGLSGQLIHWPEAFTAPLVNAGFRVIRFDNRDAGLSRHFSELGKPRLGWIGLQRALGLKPSAPYGLADMAHDTLGLLDALALPQAHIVGVSMGGMIAQRLALAAPGRCLSLTSIMSSSGARGLPGPSRPVIQAFMAKPRGRDREAVLRYYVDFFRVIGSPAFPTPAAELRALFAQTIERSYDPEGNLRQLAAIMADTHRADELHALRVPTLVLHGREDPFVPLACGEDTARRIPGARLAVIDGMGHDLPPPVCARLLAHLLPHLREHAPQS
ncbi:MAG: alpha/beta fold hydrolase [Pseudomonadota bacterium]|nr:alpha/beta fold hydrolase [Pseudomonadota bacterium]